jgi:hypothetical protein
MLLPGVACFSHSSSAALRSPSCFEPGSASCFWIDANLAPRAGVDSAVSSLLPPVGAVELEEFLSAAAATATATSPSTTSAMLTRRKRLFDKTLLPFQVSPERLFHPGGALTRVISPYERLLLIAAMGRAVKFPISLGLLLLLATVVSSGGSAKAKPTIKLVDESPVVVAGRGFVRSERVTLRTALNGRRITKVVTANRNGRFVARLAVTGDECNPFTVSAVGRAGSRAMLKRINIPPPCGPPIIP